MDMISLLKNVGGALATITTLVYVSGYLALRSRAFTLGTDPLFELAYEGYVFAGFRFMFASLIILLIVSPAVFAARSSALWLKERIPGAFLVPGQWLLLVVMAIWTLFITTKVLSVHGLLLQEKNNVPNALLEGMVMHERTGFAVVLAVFLLTALSALWLQTRLATVRDSFTCVLGIILAMQVILLPILHGSLYADRMVRVLAATPSAVKNLKEPLGIVDRTGNHVTLLGLDANTDERRLVTIKLDDLNGVPIRQIVTLSTFLHNELVHAKGAKGESVPDGSNSAHMSPTNIIGKEKSFFQRIIDSLHITFENIGSLGDNAVAYGHVWSIEFDASGKPTQPIKVGAANDLAWPVLGQAGRIYAIQQGRIVHLGKDGQSLTEVDKQKQWVKLFGVTEPGDVLGMIYENGENRLATLRPDGKIIQSPLPASDEEERWESILEQENRAYDGNRSLYVERSARGGRGFDVFLKRGEEIINVSDCGDDACGQPSLSPDSRTVLYVRKSRY